MKINNKLKRVGSILVFFTIVLTANACAHFTMVFPGGDMDVTAEDYIAKTGETKEVWIIWGHPYEHILFDMTSVPEASVTDPAGKTTKLTTTEITVSGHKAYKTDFTVTDLGDWIISVKYEDEGEELIDYVKAVVHCGVEAWDGWDNEIGQNAEVMPYTRPYGLEEGFVFTGKALYKGNIMKDAEVEIEMYHTEQVAGKVVESAEKKYDYDPPMMFTRVTKTNAQGDFAYTLDEPGIWFVGAYGPEENGLTQRGIIIVPVLPIFPAEEEKSAAAPTPASDTKDIAEIKNSLKSVENKINTMDSKVDSLDSEIKSVKSDVNAMSASEPEPAKTPMMVYVALLIAVIAVILGVYAMMKK